MTEVLSVVDACFDDIRSSYPLVYNVLMHKDVRVVDSPYFNTMATDGSEIVISPVFVQELLDKDRLVILSLHSDGRNYYRDHTITVFGYNLYEINGKEKIFFAVYDNWYRSVSYIDYDELSIISSINY